MSTHFRAWWRPPATAVAPLSAQPAPSGGPAPADDDRADDGHPAARHRARQDHHTDSHGRWLIDDPVPADWRPPSRIPPRVLPIDGPTAAVDPTAVLAARTGREVTCDA